MEQASRAYRPMPRQLPVAVEGFPFIAAALFASAAAWLMSLPIMAALALAIACAIALFFRNPERRAPEGEGLVLSPADGKVIKVERGVRAPHTGALCTRVSIFMSVLNVHVNRSPVAGLVMRSAYRAGRFLVASLDKASEHNEQNALVMEDDSGRQCVVVQIAGIIARRIVCYARQGSRLSRGERFGLIRFGSRLDVYMPDDARIDVAKGHRTRAGETVLGRFE